MSLRLDWVLICDERPCRREYSDLHDEVADLLEEAREVGWALSIDEQGTLVMARCPDCAGYGTEETA